MALRAAARHQQALQVSRIGGIHLCHPAIRRPELQDLSARARRKRGTALPDAAARALGKENPQAFDRAHLCMSSQPIEPQNPER
jgi:hypothetical protein